MSKRIVIMAGGTGGHVFPALAIAQELHLRGWQISWLGTLRGLESKVIPAQGIEIDWLAVEGVRGKGLAAKFTAVFKMLQACRQARQILKLRQPNVVLGMGGFVAAPGGLMAKVLGIPVVIHEQNRVPGTTNRLLAKFAASKVLEAFPDSFAKSIAAVCTGNPLRIAFQNLPEKIVWSAQSDRPLRIAVVGGSQGAKVLNEHVPEGLALLENIEIKHQTGQAMHDEVAQRYQNLAINAEVFAFIDDMASTYQWADLLICRAGAMTVSEVAASGLPTIFVPLLGAIDDHQTANARYLTEAGAALLLPQSELKAETIRNAVETAKQTLVAMSIAAKNKARLTATQTVSDICAMEATQ